MNTVQVIDSDRMWPFITSIKFRSYRGILLSHLVLLVFMKFLVFFLKNKGADYCARFSLPNDWLLQQIYRRQHGRKTVRKKLTVQKPIALSGLLQITLSCKYLYRDRSLYLLGKIVS